MAAMLVTVVARGETWVVVEEEEEEEREMHP
jgi:hypothetical protein